MGFFRNPEIKRSMVIGLSAACLFAALGFWINNVRTGLLVLSVCGFFLLFHFIVTYRRYRRIKKLGAELDEMLHGASVSFEDYAEGELSILQNELAKLTGRLAEQADILQRDKRYLSDTMADISHQLRSPLTAMQLIVSLLKDPKTAETRKLELYRELSQLVARINWLVESLLKMSKMDAGTAYLVMEKVSVEALLKEASEPLLVPMELREQSFKIEQNGAEWFTGDAAWTTEAVQNILKNCMEHTPRGGEITVRCAQNPLYTELVVEDNGTGFDKEDLPHIFERFYRGKKSDSQSVGIGLALARMIFAEQNATVKAENRTDGGARFIIRFYHTQV